MQLTEGSLNPDAIFTRKEAIQYLEIPSKYFDNYFRFSGEIKGFKRKGRWCFNKSELDRWKNLRDNRTFFLNLAEYEKCFEFAMKLVYGGLSRYGLRGQRTEVQVVDNVILGILVEHALQKFLIREYGTEIVLDDKVHPSHITPPDIIGVKEEGQLRQPKIFVGVKGSKMKSAYLIADEHGMPGRSADIYVFGRVDLPSDHLFRYLREHKFFKRVSDFLKTKEEFRKLEEINGLNVWICGYIEGRNLDKVTEIPGQDFGKNKYVKSVSGLKNAHHDWLKFVSML